MYNLKGFIRFNELTDNVPNETALLGELSTIAMTYAKEKGYYTNPTVPSIEIVSFTSTLTVGEDTNKVAAPSDASNRAIDIAAWILNNCQQTVLFGEVNGSYPDYIEALTTAFPELDNFSMGDIVTIDVNPGTDKKMPEWISYETNEAGEEPATVKLWLSDTSFRGQYDDYELIIIPPIEDLDDFFQSRTAVQALKNAIDVPGTLLKVAAETGQYPPTQIKSLNYNWQDSLIPPNTIAFPWTFIIYGVAGDNIDIILETLRQYIIENSSHTEEEWIERLPDIFRTTEFVIVPMWQRYAIPNQILQNGVYSAITRYVDDIELVLDAVNYAEQHIVDNVEALTFLHNYISTYVIGGVNNVDQKYRISQVMGDYIPVPTVGSGDFNRMSPTTQEWVLFMLNLLSNAETVTEFSTIPLNMSRLKRNGVLMLSGNYNNIQYLVVAKKYFLDNVQTEEL